MKLSCIYLQVDLVLSVEKKKREEKGVLEKVFDNITKSFTWLVSDKLEIKKL